MARFYTQMTEVDSITYSIVTNSLRETCSEVAETLLRTARSHAINIAHDFSVAVMDSSAKLVIGDEGIAVHLGSVDMTVQAMVDAMDSIKPGDVLITNDPYEGRNTHMADFTIAHPIFVSDDDQNPIAWIAVRAHQADIGAVDPVSMPTSSTDIYDEGVRIPPTKIVDNGQRQDQLLDLIAKNSRMEATQRGDLLAMLGAVRKGERRIRELADTHGADVVDASMSRFLNTTAAQVQDFIRELPNGTYYGESRSDANPNDESAVRVVAEVTVDGDKISFDFSDSDEQIDAATNNTLATTFAAVNSTWFTMLDLDVPLNAGSFEHLEVTAPEGLVVNPSFPCATSYATVDFMQETMEACWKALSEIEPKNLCGGWSRWVRCYVTGRNPVNGEQYMGSTTVVMGGAGATWGMDGANLVGGPILLGGLSATDPEMMEALEPLRVNRLEIRTDSGGAGRWRGGLGITVEISPINHDALFSLGGDFGQDTPPWGLLGGDTGDSVQVKVLKDDEAEKVPRSWVNITVGDGETYQQKSGGGGGMGDSFERDPEAVQQDVRNGYVSRKAAREEYGVIFQGDSLTIDYEATRSQREKGQTMEESQ